MTFEGRPVRKTNRMIQNREDRWVRALLLGGLLLAGIAGWVVAVGAQPVQLNTVMYRVPVVTIDTTQDQFVSARFDQGAVWICFYFQEQRIREITPLWPDGKYKPMKCGDPGLDHPTASVNWDYIHDVDAAGNPKPYDSDWLVSVSVGYPHSDSTVTYVDSEAVRVHR